MNGLAVFGNSLLSGSNRYLNWGTTAGDTGYGIRDNGGTLEFKNNNGIWASLNASIQNYLSLGAVTQVKFSDGTTQTTAIFKGTLAGWCAHGWGAVDQQDTPVPPAYFDPTVTGQSNYGPTHIGCSCPSGWQVVITGTCNFGNCALTPTGQMYFFTCSKQ